MPSVTRRHATPARAAVSSIALLAALLLPAAAAQARDVHFTSAGDILWGNAGYSGFDIPAVPIATDRVIYGATGNGQSFLVQGARNVGQLMFTGPYAGSGFVSNVLRQRVDFTIHGMDGLGVDSTVNQVITLPDLLAISGNQEWRINSATGGIRQIQAAGIAREIKLNGNTLILNAMQLGNYFNFDAPINGAGGLVIRGAGTTFLSGASTYSGGTLVDGGTLTIAADNNLGNVVGGVAFRGGTLHTTGSFTTARAFALEAGTATFNSDAATTLVLTTAIGGAGGLTKVGAGTLQLTGANSFTGQTNITTGTLVLNGAGSLAASQRVVADGVLDIAGTTSGASLQRLSGAGDVLVGGQTLTLTNANDTFSGKFSGTGGFVLAGGNQTLTGDSSGLTGASAVRGGVLSVNGQLGGTIDVFGGRLQGIGTVGTTINHAGGMLAPGNSIGVLTVAGNYTSNGGGLEIETVLGGDGSAADLLLITGNSLLGLAPTLVSVVNLGGPGGTTTNGIKIVEVQGARSDANAFVLNGPAIGGAYRYELKQHDVATGSDGNWYLRNSGDFAPTVPTLENYPVALLGMIDLPTLRQRAGQGDTIQPGIVTRIEGAAGHYQAAASTAGAAYDSSMFLAQIGLSGRLVDNADGSLTAGLTAQYSRHYASVFSAYGNGSNSTEGFGIGASLTWRGSEGTYIDLQGQIARFTTDLNAAGYSLVQGNGGAGFAAGIEAGHAFALDESWSVTPQAQLSYGSVGFDKFTDRFGSEVSLNNGASLKGRLGLALDYQTEWQDAEGRTAATTLYGVTSLTYEFLDGANIAVSGTDLKFAGQKFGAELGLGGTLNWAGGAHALHGELLGSTSFQGSYAVKGTLGFTSKF